MAYVLVNGVVVIREDIPVPGGVLEQLRAELRGAKAQRDRLVARIAVIKAALLEIKALDATLDVTDLP